MMMEGPSEHRPSFASPGPFRTPSGLFPSGPPRRPTYREPHPIRGGAVAAGCAGAAGWLLLFGLLGHGLVGYVWWTAVAGIAAWAVALLLTIVGDRGVAVGVAVTTAVGLGIAATAAAMRWATAGDWPLW